MNFVLYLIEFFLFYLFNFWFFIKWVNCYFLFDIIIILMFIIFLLLFLDFDLEFILNFSDFVFFEFVVFGFFFWLLELYLLIVNWICFDCLDFFVMVLSVSRENFLFGSIVSLLFFKDYIYNLFLWIKIY